MSENQTAYPVAVLDGPPTQAPGLTWAHVAKYCVILMVTVATVTAGNFGCTYATVVRARMEREAYICSHLVPLPMEPVPLPDTSITLAPPLPTVEL